MTTEALPPVLKRIFETGARLMGVREGREILELEFQDDVQLRSFRRLDGPNGANELQDLDAKAIAALREILDGVPRAD